uniref:Uncharacterized protein n=1 Tax=Rhodnius prolixus TaxID=13249 RepID=T1HRL3_RHOPR
MTDTGSYFFILLMLSKLYMEISPSIMSIRIILTIGRAQSPAAGIDGGRLY